jgi:hypothetical protein
MRFAAARRSEDFLATIKSTLPPQYFVKCSPLLHYFLLQKLKLSSLDNMAGAGYSIAILDYS